MPQSSDGRRGAGAASSGVATAERATGTAGGIAESVLGAGQHVPGMSAVTAQHARPARKAVAEVIRRPEAALHKTRRLPVMTAMVHDAVTPILTGKVDDWRTEYAYSTGLQAFIYGFPYIYNAKLRHAWVTERRNPAYIPYAAVNHFWHARELVDATYRDGGCPNNDTLYSLAWVNLSDEPIILSHPDMADRYFTFELMAFTSDNFDYVGQRTTGSKAGHFAITGPSWKGQLPRAVRKTLPSPTPWILVLGRTLVDGPDDLPDAHALQDHYKLAPLSLWGQPNARVPQRRKVYAPADPANDPLGPWKSLNAMLAENPPPPHHALLLDQFARIGIGPGLDVDAQPEVVKRGLLRAALIGTPLLRGQFLGGSWATVVNGWRYPPSNEGRLGDDYLQRAADQSLAGITANDLAEAVYLVNFDDSEGAKLSRQGRYELRFAGKNLPPVDAFWSLTAYTQDMNLIPNDAQRYSVGDRTPGLIRDPDGGVTIYLQPKTPGDGRAPNWLPTSAAHPWFVILRMYRPRKSVIDATWKCPGIIKTR